MDYPNLTDDERDRVRDDGDAVVVTLTEPLCYRKSQLDDGDTEVSELRLTKRVKGKHLKKMDSATGEVGKSLALAAAVSGVPTHAIDELSATDFDLVMTVVEPFLPKRRGTGRD